VSNRRIDVFFYGLFMDDEVLRQAGVAPINPRRAYLEGFELRIGQRATLVPSAGARACGMLVALTHAELDRLYGAPGLEQYRPEAVLVQPLEATPTPALCYNLRDAPQPGERNPEYARGFSLLSADWTSRQSTSRPFARSAHDNRMLATAGGFGGAEQSSCSPAAPDAERSATGASVEARTRQPKEDFSDDRFRSPRFARR
jgi:hypothetical protein